MKILSFHTWALELQTWLPGSKVLVSYIFHDLETFSQDFHTNKWEDGTCRLNSTKVSIYATLDRPGNVDDREEKSTWTGRNCHDTVYMRVSASSIFPQGNAGLHLANFQRLSRPKTVRTSASDKIREIVDARVRRFSGSINDHILVSDCLQRAGWFPCCPRCPRCNNYFIVILACLSLLLLLIFQWLECGWNCDHY